MVKKLVILVIIFSTLSCNKDDDQIPDKYTGTITALKNGEEWKALAFFEEINSFDETNRSSTFILTGNVIGNDGYIAEIFNVRKILSNFNIQDITSTDNQNNLGLLSAEYYTIWEGDALNDIYALDTTATNNFIQIKGYNESKAEITGIFNVSLILTRAGNNPGTPPETLEIKNGEFTVKVKREWFE